MLAFFATKIYMKFFLSNSPNIGAPGEEKSLENGCDVPIGRNVAMSDVHPTRSGILIGI